MKVGTSLLLLALLGLCGVCQAKEQRWVNFAEDSDLKFYLDKKTVKALPDNVYLFWVKSVAKNQEYLKREYNLNDLAYILTNYELDCAQSSYRVRGAIMFDKNRKELNKTLSGQDDSFQPVPPESMLELAQDEICVNEEGTEPEVEQPAAALPGAPRGRSGSQTAPATTAAPAATVPRQAPAAGEPEAPAAPLPAEPPSLQ